jgi:hypothetical protein
MRTQYFDTLRDALESANVSHLWDINQNIDYGQTIDFSNDTLKCSVYRTGSGRYESPIVYSKY